MSEFAMPEKNVEHRDRGALEFRKLSREQTNGLAELFIALAQDPDSVHFHPHPFTLEEAQQLGSYEGKDLYYVAVCRGLVQAYGMLRGWDEGYEVPSLGIAVHPEFRGMNLGETMTRFLHSSARQRGARSVRLKVYSQNIAARSLYEKIGYQFKGEERGQIVGMFELK